MGCTDWNFMGGTLLPTFLSTLPKHTVPKFWTLFRWPVEGAQPVRSKTTFFFCISNFSAYCFFGCSGDKRSLGLVAVGPISVVCEWRATWKNRRSKNAYKQINNNRLLQPGDLSKYFCKLLLSVFVGFRLCLRIFRNLRPKLSNFTKNESTRALKFSNAHC